MRQGVHGGIRGRALRIAIAVLAIAAHIPMPAESASPPEVLLIPFAGVDPDREWVARAINNLLEKDLRSLSGLKLSGGARRENALREIGRPEVSGPEELAEVLRRAGAAFAVIGRFEITLDRLDLDVRIFEEESEEEKGTLQTGGEFARALELLSEVVRFIATEVGATISAEEEAGLARRPTNSLKAYHNYMAAREAGDPEEKITLLTQAVELDPDYLNANLRLGVALYQKGSPDAALPYVQKAAALGGDVPEARNNLGVLLADMGESAAALTEFEMALEINPGYQEARLNLARLLEEGKKFDRAEKEYSTLLENNPENVAARHSLALLYDRTGRPDWALRAFQVLSRQAPDLAENYFLKAGQESRQEKKFKNAERYFLRAVEINPQLAQGYAELGTTSYLAGKYRKGVEYFHKALALEPQRPEFHYYLGLALDKTEQKEEALEAYRRAVELGGPVESRLSLAKAYLDSGDASRAIEELNQILEDDLGHDEAQKMLARAMAGVESQRQKVAQRAEFATHRLERLEEIIDDLTRANSELESRLYAIQGDKQALERELEQATTWKEERDRWEQEVLESRDRIEPLQSARLELERRLKEKKIRYENLSEKTAELEAELGRVRERNRELTVRVEVLEQERERDAADLEKSREQARLAQEAKEEELATYREKEKGLWEQTASLHGSVAEMKAELAGWAEELRRVAQTAQEGRAVLDTMRRDLAQQAMELGRIYLRDQAWAKAEPYFRKVVEVDSENSEAYSSLGEIYYHLGQFARSREMYEKAKEQY